MNGNPDRRNINNDIDLVDFSANREMEEIRRNELIAKEERRKRAAEIRRREMIRQKKIARIKRAIFAWCALVFAVIVIVAVIIGIVSAFGDDSTASVPEVGETVPEAEILAIKKFRESTDGFYGGDDAKEMNSLLSELKASLETEKIESLSYLDVAAETYMWQDGLDGEEKLRDYIRDVPIFSNGYVWSEKGNMKSTVSNSYLYDTNAAFINAVCEICLWDGSTAFLSEVDTTTDGSKDFSKGMTVGEKLEKAAAYYFDTTDLNGGGIRYNAEEKIVYVLTSDNDGTSAGKSSNMFYNLPFGYLDAYNNIVFNKAMQSMERISFLSGNAEDTEKYKIIAEENRVSINNTFYDKKLGRYIGCIDKDGAPHDGGFTALNLAAISFGIADDEKTESILLWIDGKRSVATDTLDSKKILANPVKPAFSTVKATDFWWNSLSEKYPLSDADAFGKYPMNGKESALSGRYDMLARKKTDKNSIVVKANNVFESFAAEKITDEDAFSENAMFEYALLSTAIRESLGINTDGKTLEITPARQFGSDFGIKGISYGANGYGVLYGDDAVFLVADSQAAVKMKIGGFDKNASLVLTVVDNADVESTEPIISDEEGCISIAKKFGGESYIRICAEKNKK